MGKALLKIGRFYSAVIMKNIGMFITLGILRTLFMPEGWIENADLYGLADVVYQTILPIMIAYSCGKKVGEELGGMVAAVSIVGVITTQNISSVMGAMILGPIAGYVTKIISNWIKDKIPTGTEMLIKNLIIGLLGLILILAAFYGVTPVLIMVEQILSQGIDMMVQKHILPFMAVIIEPAKLLFLNNSMNHGILVPLGMEQVSYIGKSVLFLIETNPGPGFGILLAFFLREKEKRKTYSSYMVIELIGGIHEVYFPFVLLYPWLIVVAIISGFTGVYVFETLGTGLVGVASPGSILTLLLMAPKSEGYKVVLGVLASVVVSFSGAILVLMLEKKKEEVTCLEKEESQFEHSIPQFVYFVCDAGFGSSAMGAALFRKKLKKENVMGIQVAHASIEEIPENANLIFVQGSLKDKIQVKNQKTRYVYLDHFLDAPEYGVLIEEWKAVQRREEK